MAESVNLAEKFAKFQDTWSPRLIAELNGQLVKLAKLDGELVWHAHDDEDELFLLIEGSLTIQMRPDPARPERIEEVDLKQGELFVVPKGVEHNPIAKPTASVMLFEPAATKHTGAVAHERTAYEQPWI